MTLPQGWAEVILGDVAILSTGFGFPKEFQGNCEGEIPFAKVSDISRSVAKTRGILKTAANYVDAHQLASLKAKTIPAGSTVFAKIGEAVWLNRRAITDRALIIDNNVMALSPIEGLCEPHFLLRWMHTVELGPLTVATTVPSVRASDVAALVFPLPPLAEQRRIVAKLDALTAHLTRARVELACIPLLAERLRAKVLNQVFRVDSDNFSLRQLTAFVTSGSRGWAKYYSDKGPAFIRVADVQRRNINLDLHDLQRVAPPKNTEGERTALLPGDIVVTITADLGRVGVVPADLGPGFVNQHVALVRPKDTNQSAWIAWYLSSDAGQQQMLAKDRGVTKAGLGLEDIRDVGVPMPRDAVRQEGLKAIQAAFTRADRLEAEAERAMHLLDRLEAAVLAKALRGELVPQDPADEPATDLLDRIRQSRKTVPKLKRGRKAKE